MNTKKISLFTIPNLMSLGNLLCGSLGVVLITKDKESLPVVALLMLIALGLDFFDGYAARLLKQYSDIGKQLDSLADMVTFGLLPGIMVKNMFEHHVEEMLSFPTSFYFFSMGLVGFLIPIFSALRLAKFNIDEEQQNYFKGLPTPANAILILSLNWILANQQLYILSNELVLLVIVVFNSWLMISNIPLMAFKFKKFSWKGNELSIIFLTISLIGVIMYQFVAVPFLIFLYVSLSVIFKKHIIRNYAP